MDLRLPRNINIIFSKSKSKKIGLHQGAYTTVKIKNKNGKNIRQKRILLDKQYSTNPRVRYHEKAHYIWENRFSSSQKRRWHNVIDSIKYDWYQKPGIKSRASIKTITVKTDRATGLTVGEELFAKYYSHYKQGLKFRQSEQLIKKFLRNNL
jgi:hypothetical protein